MVGPVETDLEKVREMQYRARETDLRQNHFWLSQLMTYEQHGWDLAQIPSVPTRTSALTVASIQDSARRYLDLTNYVQVTLLPETVAREAP